jgi:hypothetical protein
MEGDLPIREIEKMANAQIDKGFFIWQKWTCAHCGSRQTMDKPNVLYLTGECQECKRISPIPYCGFMLASSGAGAELIQSSLDQT